MSYSLIPVAAYFAIVAAAAILVVFRKEAMTWTDHAVGRRRDYGRWTIFATMAATYIGPAYSLGVVDKTYQHTMLYALIFMSSVIHIYLTGRYLAPRIRNTELAESQTLGDIAAHFYGKSAAVAVGFITAIQYMAFVAVLSLGGAKILVVLFDIPPYVGVVAVAGFVGLYTYVSGLPGVVKTDVVQFFFLFVLVIIALYVAFGTYGAGTELRIEQVFSLSPPGLSGLDMVGLLVGFLLGEALQPFYLVRAFIGRDALEVRKGFTYTAIFGVVWFLCLGVVGVILAATSAGQLGDSGVLIVAVKNFFGTEGWGGFFFGLFAASVLGVVMSTLDSVLNAGAVGFAKDTIGTLLGAKADDEKAQARLLEFTKMSTIVFVLGGAALASTESDFVGLLFIAYSVWVPTVVGPIAYALLKMDTRGWARTFWMSVISGIIGYYAAEHYLSNSVPPILAGLGANLLALLISEFVLPSARRASIGATLSSNG